MTDLTFKTEERQDFPLILEYIRKLVDYERLGALHFKGDALERFVKE
jgi:hypothetical protein